MGTVNPYIRYPIYPRPMSLLERMMLLTKTGFMKCLVCGEYARIHTIDPNFRETCRCSKCSSMNRQRQITYVLLHALTSMGRTGVASLKDVGNLHDLVIYNTEAAGLLHNQLAQMPHYRCSNYYGDTYKSGDQVNGVTHQDLMALSFDDASIDIVLSSDVFEHIADPYLAHREVYRVLRRGGRHIFTVPFLQTDFWDDQRALINEAGELVLLKEPIYHGDPVSIDPKGALVFTLFSFEMLLKLDQIGFQTNFFLLDHPRLGIFGSNALVFEAVKR